MAMGSANGECTDNLEDDANTYGSAIADDNGLRELIATNGTYD